MFPDQLYHFTCRHSRADIGTGPRALLLPFMHPLLGCRVLWLTSEASPDRHQTGLTMRHQRCDRMEYRYVVTDLSRCHPWLRSAERERAPEDWVKDLESEGDPEHWWVSTRPVVAAFDRSWMLVETRN